MVGVVLLLSKFCADEANGVKFPHLTQRPEAKEGTKRRQKVYAMDAVSSMTLN